MIYLETRRLVLKPHTMQNLHKIHRWDNDDEILYYSDNQPEDRQPLTLNETAVYVERMVKNDPVRRICHYAIHKKADDDFIGYGMVAYIDTYNRSCKLGIQIGEKSEWGQGYGREALSAVIDYCFDSLKMNRIGAEIYDFNLRSIRLFESLGFKREGVARQAVWKRGMFSDEYIYGLLRAEWFA